LNERIADRAGALQAQVEAAYRRGQLVDPRGAAEPTPRPDQRAFAAWLDACADRIPRRSYPGFERFAPAHGPLPHEALRQFMRFATEHDLGSERASDLVEVIREGYLVPMRLLRRAGRGYAVAGKLDKHELVAQVSSLL